MNKTNSKPIFFISEKIKVIHGNYGLQIIAIDDIKKNEIIERSPTIIIPDNEFKHKGVLGDYVFTHLEMNLSSLGLGYLSLYNHSHTPNASYEYSYMNDKKFKNRTIITVIANKKICKSEQIMINYGYDVN